MFIKKIALKDFFLFTEAWGLLAISRLILVFIPFSKVLPLLGKQVSPDTTPDRHNKHFVHIGTAIARACRYSFWRTQCFEQALCAKFMLKLRKRKSTIYFGVKKDESAKELLAHAWLVCNNEIVTGGKQAEYFKILSVFYG
ncbi:lasso peptide biosynthesis B2 protein [Emticicia sp. 17c]|uniref:lasso peptide biosynthesis B2 protein n=1 Tax=Emticicia sp. 17c TaxID=3127704 RepID=UPI00301CA837